MPYNIERRGSQWCVRGPSGIHGCHDTREKAIKQQRALYAAEEASSAAEGSMSAQMHPAQTKDVSLLKLAMARARREGEYEAEQAVVLAQGGLADPEVASQTVALIGHLADRLRTAELNTAALVDVLQAVAADSTSSRSALLEALQGISERLAEAPQVNVTVPVPEVNVTVEQQAAHREVVLERDSTGQLVGASVDEVAE